MAARVAGVPGAPLALCVDHDGTPAPSWAQWWRWVAARDMREAPGGFALAAEEADGAVVLARDAIGERSLYYAVTRDGRLAYGSRVREVAEALQEGCAIDATSLATYLSWGYLPGRETLVQGVMKVLPGEIVVFRNGALERRAWWSPPPEPVAWRDAESLRVALRAALEAAVRARLPVGEAVGVTLSGGVDSSLVAALAAALHDRPVVSYSVSFGDGYRNELPYSALVARHCGIAHRIVEVSPAAVVERFDATMAMLQEPIGDPLTVPNAMLFEAAAQEVGVVLNGEGGDPCFGGPKNGPMLLAELFAGLHAGDRDNTRHRRAASYLRAHQKCYDNLSEMLTPDILRRIPEAALEVFVEPWLHDARWRNFITRLMVINLTCKGAHHILAKVDAISAPYGVTTRAPLFDREVVELAFAIPPQLKVRGAVEKYLLKAAVGDLLPRAIIQRPKSGMLVPVHQWFKGPLRAFARERLLDGLAPLGFFDRSWLERLVSDNLGGIHPRRGTKIWLLLTLESWLRSLIS